VTDANRRTAELTAAREGLAEIEELVAAGRAEYMGTSIVVVVLRPTHR